MDIKNRRRRDLLLNVIDKGDSFEILKCFWDVWRCAYILAPTGPAGPAITPGPAVEDEEPGAGTPELVDKINELLASLRTAGVIAT